MDRRDKSSQSCFRALKGEDIAHMLSYTGISPLPPRLDELLRLNGMTDRQLEEMCKSRVPEPEAEA